jgi:hypothetical protein
VFTQAAQIHNNPSGMSPGHHFRTHLKTVRIQKPLSPKGHKTNRLPGVNFQMFPEVSDRLTEAANVFFKGGGQDAMHSPLT